MSLGNEEAQSDNMDLTSESSMTSDESREGSIVTIQSRGEKIKSLYNDIRCALKMDTRTLDRLRTLVRKEIFVDLKFCCGEGIVEHDRGFYSRNMTVKDGDEFRCNRNERQKMLMNGVSFHQKEQMRVHHRVEFQNVNYPSYGYATDILEKWKQEKVIRRRLHFGNVIQVKF